MTSSHAEPAPSPNPSGTAASGQQRVFPEQDHRDLAPGETEHPQRRQLVAALGDEMRAPL